MNKHPKATSEEYRAKENIGVSTTHLTKVFFLYLSLGTVVTIWVYFSGFDIFHPLWMMLVVLLTAALTTIIYWYTAHKTFHIESVSLIVTLILSMLGIGVTDYSPMQSYYYWGAMLLILAVAGIAIGWVRADFLNRPMREILVIQIVHWCATAVAVLSILLLLKAGRLNYEGTGLVLLVLMGLATFLDGCRVSYYFSLIGVLMIVTAITAAFIEQYLWVLIILGLGIAMAIFFWERRKRVRLEQVLIEKTSL